MVHETPRRTDVTRLPVDGSASSSEIARAVNGLVDNHHEAHGAVTVLNGTTETVIRSPIFGGHTIIQLIATDAASAALQWWQKSIARRQVTIGHADPGADLEFFWVADG